MKDSLELIREMAREDDPVPTTRVTPAGTPDEEEGETPAFGYLRGIRDRALNVEFRRAVEGDSFSMPYSWLGPSRYHPSSGVVMLFAGAELYLVTVRGRNLNTLAGGVSLYDRGLLRHRVTWVQEATSEESRALPESACVIERIEIRLVTQEEAAIAFALDAADAG
jgi:hypothetical protein